MKTDKNTQDKQKPEQPDIIVPGPMNAEKNYVDSKNNASNNPEFFPKNKKKLVLWRKSDKKIIYIVIVIIIVIGGFYVYNNINSALSANATKQKENLVRQKLLNEFDLRGFTISSVDLTQSRFVNVFDRYTFHLTNNKGYCGLTEINYTNSTDFNDVKSSNWKADIDDDVYRNIYNYKSKELILSEVSRDNLIKLVTSKYCPDETLYEMNTIPQEIQLLEQLDISISKKIDNDVNNDITKNASRTKDKYISFSYHNSSSINSFDIYYLDDNNWVYISSGQFS